ncbi:type 1 glutamine amidotransferase domain-containing protein [uncultured Tenacibaculum sp.]|uniref:type 1 glutamine amidotransferase domain-containing protein n=1 Tax=uncultured Tenacibaculum sp. TaxID=174713 RepID=UPI00262BF335|nr:type 1 glutamine amidotransferase domain-containing protein [uncultured Tenacibaculum sp.]
MLKRYPFLKYSLGVLASLILIIVCFGFWFVSLLPAKKLNIENTIAEEIPYLSQNRISNRGKILTVVTSTAVMGKSQKKTGYELTELSRAYYVFQANGYEVSVASPLGGKAPVVLDKEDMGIYDYAFLNDEEAQEKINNTLVLGDIDFKEYDAVFFVGGKGAMFDFPNHPMIHEMLKNYYENNKVIGAVCHGPAALVNVKLSNGSALLKDKKITSFTNEEELFLIPEAKNIFPFLLEEEIRKQGAKFISSEKYLEKVNHDENIITGQNPWSTWKVAETMIKQLGHTPKEREITGEENAVSVLAVYKSKGKKAAKEKISEFMFDNSKPVDRLLIAQHSMLEVLGGKVSGFVDLVSLVSFIKSCEKKLLKNN